MTENNRLRVIFAGTPDFATHHLQALLAQQAQTLDVIAVYTQPDRPSGRGRKLIPSPVKRLALEHHVPVHQPASLKDTATQEQLAALHADIMVVVAYGLLLPPAVLATPRLGCINVHASLLPRWRGAAPIHRAIEAGDKTTGVTIMQMNEGLDTGPMLLTRECAIDPADTTASLHDKLAALGAPALLEALQQLAENRAQPVNQDGALATYADKILKREAELDWRQEAQTLVRKVRAFDPAPGAFSSISGERVKIWQASVASSEESATPGTILETTGDAILVACGEQVLRLEQIQLPNKKRLPVAEILKARTGLFTAGAGFAEPNPPGALSP